MATVYSVSLDRKNDYREALVHGDLRHINMKYVHPDELEPSPLGDVIPLEYIENMAKAVNEFNPKTDFLLIAGDDLQLVAMTAMLTKRHGTFKVLRWDRQAKGYARVTISTW